MSLGQAVYAIETDPTRDLIMLTLSGFFSKDDAAGFERDKAAAMNEMHCGPNRHLTLCDISALNIQSQDVIAQFRALLADPRFHSRRIAFVLGDSLARMQLRRLIAGRVAECFGDRAEAEAWLFAPDVQVNAA